MTTYNSPYDATLVAPHSRERVHRWLVILLAVITGLLLTLGVSGWWLLAKINARYSQTLSETASSLSQLHEVGLRTLTGYGNIMQLSQTTDPAARAALHRTVLAERAKNDALFAQLQRTLSDPKLVAALDEALAKRRLSLTRADAFIAAALGGGAHKVNSEESLLLLQDYLTYQAACNALTDQIEAASRQASRQMAADIKNMRLLFLIVGVLPIVAGLGFLLLTLVLLKVIKLDAEAHD